jgi:hypothetical protein
MRFSLATLLLVILWIGAMIPVVLWRHPWEKVFKSEPSDDELEKRVDSIKTPDGLRECVPGPASSGSEVSWQVLDSETKKPLAIIWMLNGTVFANKFLDNNTLEFVHLGVLSLNDAKYSQDRSDRAIFARAQVWHSIYHRRFPELWWGHFYRPEVWCALVLTALLAWRFAKQKQLTTDK